MERPFWPHLPRRPKTSHPPPLHPGSGSSEGQSTADGSIKSKCDEPTDGDGKDDSVFYCVICHDVSVAGGRHPPCALSCGHVFGLNCITEWVIKQKRDTCPICSGGVNEVDFRLLFGTSGLGEMHADWKTREQDWKMKEAAYLTKINDLLEINKQLVESVIWHVSKLSAYLADGNYGLPK